MPTSRSAGSKRRLTRLRQRRTTTGLLSVEEAAALSSVGFHQVSEVMGAVALGVTTTGFYPGMAQFSSLGAKPFHSREGVDRNALPTYTSSRASVAVGTPPTITAMKSGYGTALRRLVEEARAVGGDGVVGIRVTTSKTHSGGRLLWSFLAIGTAIRSLGRTRAETPFTTALSPTQTAGALRAGWVPISYLACPVMAIRWVDQESQTQRRLTASNGEVLAHTEAVNACRQQARTDFAAAARSAHADGAVMSGMSLHLGPNRNLVEVTTVITGTALAQFAAGGDLAPISIIPLT